MKSVDHRLLRGGPASSPAQEDLTKTSLKMLPPRENLGPGHLAGPNLQVLWMSAFQDDLRRP